MLQTVNNIIM